MEETPTDDSDCEMTGTMEPKRGSIFALATDFSKYDNWPGLAPTNNEIRTIFFLHVVIL